MTAHSDSDSIGLIGIGLLGSALAERFIDGGKSILGFDIDEGQVAKLSEFGGVAVENAREVVRRCPIICLSLPTSDTVSALLEQLEADFQPGQIVIDTTTGDPTQMVSIGVTLRRWGVEYVEALVAGSSAQVRAGQVVLFVGGEDQTVTRVESLLSTITPTHFHLGPVGNASRFKLVHNLMLGLHRAVLAEGLTFASSLGIAPTEALRILPQTPAASAVMATKGQRMITGDFGPQVRLGQHLKDVTLILAEARRTGCQTPLSQLHRTLLEHAEELGFGDADNSAIIEAFRSPKRTKLNS